MTPLQLEILLHYATSAAQRVGMDIPAYADGALQLWEEGALEGNPGDWSVTDLGRAWLLAACRVPKPRAVWVDATGQELMATQNPK